MALVYTTRGLVPRDKLVCTPEIGFDDNNMYVRVTWTLDGEMVRQDAWVNSFRGIEDAAVEQGNLGGGNGE